MILDNPELLWLLLILPFFLFILGFWGLLKKKKLVKVFPLSQPNLLRKQVEKYIMVGFILALLTISLSHPQLAYYSYPVSPKNGELMLLIDVSGSMAARENIYSSSRMERSQVILDDVINYIEQYQNVKISLYGFTEVARSIVPFIGIEDYQYLKESVNKVLDIYATPGSGSSLGKSLLDAIPRFSEAEQSKVILLLSDGEAYINNTRGLTYHEKLYIEDAIEQLVEKNVIVISVGIGEKTGAKIPLYNSDGEFTGEYSKIQREVKGTVYTASSDYVTYLEENGLKKIAAETGGIYFFEEDLEGLEELIAEKLDYSDGSEFQKKVIDYKPITTWFIIAAIPIWIVFVRRHVLA